MILIRNPKENGGKNMELFGKIRNIAWNNWDFQPRYNLHYNNELDGYMYVGDGNSEVVEMSIIDFLDFFRNEKHYTINHSI